MLIGLAGAFLTWFAAVHDDFLGLGRVSGSYLPIPPLFLAVLISVGVNPLLRRFRPGWALKPGQLALIFAMLLAACLLPANPVLHDLPSFLSGMCREVAAREDVADLHEKTGLPASLFPDRAVHGAELTVVTPLFEELPDNESIPWAAWIPPLLSWGALITFAGMFMIGIGMIVCPQWRGNERLPFPLAKAYRPLVAGTWDDSGESLFRRQGLWYGVGIVFLLYTLTGLNRYFPDRCPAFPLHWNLHSIFTGELLSAIPGWIVTGRIYFALVGIAFLAPRRISFSLWFFTVVYSLHQAIDRVYFPPYDHRAADDHRLGAMLAVTAFILWMGRRHWAHVAKCVVKKPGSDEDRANRLAGLFFICGALGVTAWLMWIGLSFPWALTFVAMGGIVSLVTTRLVAETGLPFLRLYSGSPLVAVIHAPLAWSSHVTIFAAVIMDWLFNTGSRVCASVFGSHALVVEEKSGVRTRTARTAAMVGVLALGTIVYLAIKIDMSYSNYQSQRGAVIGESSTGRVNKFFQTLQRFEDGNFRPGWARVRPPRVLFGATLGGVLQLAYIYVPRWPLHPVGLLLVRQYYANVAWPSLFLGWLASVLVVRYGGGRAFRKAQAVFIGLVMGEILVTVLWRVIAYLVATQGPEYQDIGFLPG